MIQYRSFRFSGTIESTQFQNINCGLTLHKLQDVESDATIINENGSKIISKPETCSCYEINECASMMPTSTQASTTITTIEGTMYS